MTLKKMRTKSWSCWIQRSMLATPASRFLAWFSSLAGSAFKILIFFFAQIFGTRARYSDDLRCTKSCWVKQRDFFGKSNSWKNTRTCSYMQGLRMWDVKYTLLPVNWTRTASGSLSLITKAEIWWWFRYLVTLQKDSYLVATKTYYTELQKSTSIPKFADPKCL